MIPYGRQQITEDDIQSVINVLRSDYLTQGPVVPAFEDAVSRYCGAEYAVATNSATSALHLACIALGVGKGDIVWTTAVTFVASANCALYCGAQVDFVDIDPATNNISIQDLTRKLEIAKSLGRLPKVLIPVHLGGYSCDMVEIFRLSRQYEFKIIEDASHAIGASYRGSLIGCCEYSDITIFSFHPVKIITTGEGGMALTNNFALAKKMTLLRSHGITRELGEMSNVSHGPWYYEQLELGFNYRMSEMEAALGISQLTKLNEFIQKRVLIAEKYDELLADTNIRLPCHKSKDATSSLHLYIIRLDLKHYVHREVFERLRLNGIGVNLHYIPVYRHPFFSKMGFAHHDFPGAEAYYAEAISLPIYPMLTEFDQEKVLKSLIKPIGFQTLF